MKNTLNYSSLLLAIISITFTSCDNNNDCKAGSGGNVTIVAKPQHHGATIYNQGNYPDTAFIKFDTKDFPGDDPSKYNMIVVGDSGEDHVHIEGLKCGDYYIYMTGFDTAANERVKGGLPYSFSNESGEIDLVIPVTE